VQADDVVPAGFMESIRLKDKMLTHIRYVLIMFFGPKFLLYLYQSLHYDNEFATEKLKGYV